MPKEAEKRIEDIKKEIDISNCKILLDSDDFSHIHSYFSPYDKKLDFIEKYPKISSYTIFYDVIKDGNDSRKIKNILLPYINFIKKSKLGNFLLKNVVVVTDELINNVSYKIINIFGIKIKIRWQ